jgi:hypothetical protein
MNMSFVDFLFYVGIGALFASAFFMTYLKLGPKMDWRSWTLFTIAFVMILLGLGWAYASFGESESVAAVRGLLIFGVFGLIFGGIGTRFIREAA